MRVLIIGDAFIDVWRYYRKVKENPEQPGTFVYKFIDERECVGGVSNTAHAFRYIEPEIEIQLEHNEMRPRKVRFETDDGMLRIDDEENLRLPQIYFKDSYDAIIISDYNKGCVTEKLMKKLKNKFSGVPIFVDTKPENYGWYKDVFCVTPNYKELEQLYPKETDIVKSAKRLSKEINSNVIVTLGENGCLLVNDSKDMTIPYEGIFANKVNVSGAGDVFLASLCINFLKTKNLKTATDQANKNAALSVENQYTGFQ